MDNTPVETAMIVNGKLVHYAIPWDFYELFEQDADIISTKYENNTLTIKELNYFVMLYDEFIINIEENEKD